MLKNQTDSLQPQLCRGLLFAIILCGVVLRILYLGELHLNPLVDFSINQDTYDQFRFWQPAKDFLYHSWVGSTQNTYSPTYAYVIAIIIKLLGENVHTVFAVQALLSVLGIYIIYQCTILLFENRLTGLIAATLYSFYAPLLFYDGILLRASLITNLNLFTLYTLLRAFKEENKKFYYISGTLIGFSAALRPSLLPFFLLTFFIFKKPFNLKIKLTSILVTSLGILTILSPFILKTLVTQSEEVIYKQNPSIFWLGNTRDASGISINRSPLRAKLANEADGSFLKSFALLGREIQKYPKNYTGLYLRKIIMFFNGYEIPANVNYEQATHHSRILNFAIFDFRIVSPLALIGLGIGLFHFRKLNLLYTFIISLTFFIILFHVQGRYRLVAVPFYIIFAAYAITWIAQIVKQRNTMAIIVATFLIIIFGSGTKPHEGIIKSYFGAKIRIIDHSNLALAYYDYYQRNQNNLSEVGKEKILFKSLNEVTIAISRLKHPVLIKNHSEYLAECLMLKSILLRDLQNFRLAQDTFLEATQFAPHRSKEFQAMILDSFDIHVSPTWRNAK